MIVRAALVGMVLAALLGATLVFEAAGASALAFKLVDQARANDAPVVRAHLLDRAEAAVTESWARPHLWHAGATEALSGALFLKAQNDTEARAASRDWAAHAVRLAPVQPNAWLRLALLSEIGVANSLCAPAACLTRSWDAAPLLDPDAECTRLQLAHRLGMLDPIDARLLAFVRISQRRRATQCLATFLEPAQTLAVLLRANAASR